MVLCFKDIYLGVPICLKRLYVVSNVRNDNAKITDHSETASKEFFNLSFRM